MYRVIINPDLKRNYAEETSSLEGKGTLLLVGFLVNSRGRTTLREV